MFFTKKKAKKQIPKQSLKTSVKELEFKKVLFEFKTKLKNSSKNEAFASVLARHLSKLVKAYKF